MKDATVTLHLLFAKRTHRLGVRVQGATHFTVVQGAKQDDDDVGMCVCDADRNAQPPRVDRPPCLGLFRSPKISSAQKSPEFRPCSAQPVVLFSHISSAPATSQSVVFLSHNKSASATSHQPAERGRSLTSFF
jgi:hypothetical protein